MTGRWLGFVVLIVLMAAGYGWWLRLTKGVRAVGQADAVVIISEGRAVCSVRRADTKTRHDVPCRDVGSYLRNDLRIGPGAAVGITAVGKVGRDAVAAVSSDLSGNGYKIAGIMRVGLIGEPARAH
jgi:hypothetical protein